MHGLEDNLITASIHNDDHHGTAMGGFLGGAASFQSTAIDSTAQSNSSTFFTLHRPFSLLAHLSTRTPARSHSLLNVISGICSMASSDWNRNGYTEALFDETGQWIVPNDQQPAYDSDVGEQRSPRVAALTDCCSMPSLQKIEVTVPRKTM